MIFKKVHIKRLFEITEEKELWSTIPGYDGYLVSNQGRVWSSVKNDIMNGEATDKGYLRVALRDDDGNKRKIRIHRLVAETYIPNPEGKSQVDHKNGVKIDNRAINLRWLSNQENQIAAVQKGGRKTKTNKDAQDRLRQRVKKFEAKRASELEEIKARNSDKSSD